MVLTIVACNNGQAERDTGIAVLGICLFGRCTVDMAVVNFREGFACPNCVGFVLGRRDGNDGSRNGFFIMVGM